MKDQYWSLCDTSSDQYLLKTSSVVSSESVSVVSQKGRDTDSNISAAAGLENYVYAESLRMASRSRVGFLAALDPISDT